MRGLCSHAFVWIADQYTVRFWLDAKARALLYTSNITIIISLEFVIVSNGAPMVNSGLQLRLSMPPLSPVHVPVPGRFFLFLFFSFFNFLWLKNNFGQKTANFNGDYTKTHRIYPIFSPKQKFTGVAKKLPKHYPWLSKYHSFYLLSSKHCWRYKA